MYCVRHRASEKMGKIIENGEVSEKMPEHNH